MALPDMKVLKHFYILQCFKNKRLSLFYRKAVIKLKKKLRKLTTSLIFKDFFSGYELHINQKINCFFIIAAQCIEKHNKEKVTRGDKTRITSISNRNRG